MTRETLPYDCGKFIVDLPATQTARRSPIRYLDLRGLGLRHSPCSVPQDSTQRTTSSCGTPGAPDRASASAALMCACCQCFNAPAAAAPSSPWVSQRSCPSQPQLNSTLHISSLSHAQIGAGMAEKDRFTLQDDLPKEDPWKEDLLGFAPFAERLSKVIGSIDAPNGYVIGLHGEWGSGKTTALNFVRAFLRKNNQEVESGERRIDIIEFRPWIVSGHQDLIAAFLKVVSEHLASTKAKWLARQGKRLLRLFKATSDPLVDSAATLAMTMDPSVGVASHAVAAAAKKPLSAAIDKFLEDPSAQTAYEHLKKALSKRGKRFLVVIDDLDRLQNEEIRSIMQMVKTVGRLPNVTYILAYDRAIVWNALDTPERIGPRFAEKIVQQEVELPQPSKHSLLVMLDAEIAFLPYTSPASLRWHYILQDGVRRWVRHPRDVFRLANAVKFSWPALKGEIDPQDLLAMEGLSLFDVTAFNWVRWNRDFLFGEGRFFMSTDENRKAFVNELQEKLPSERREQVLRLLAVLFPSKSKLFEGKYTSLQEANSEVVRRRGIGCEAGYDTYFALHPSPDAIPKTIIDEMMANLGDEEALVSAFELFVCKNNRQGEPMIGQLLQELQFRFQSRDHVAPT
jgi:predicted KAP-like P-loop ATPase